MKKIIHKAEDRGVAEFGWLHSRHSFSFGQYYNPDKMNFGLLRVLNDDIVEPGKGFGKHPHNNMEIISMVLKGELEHQDSMGNGDVISENEVQVMSAGHGIMHSEFNPSDENKVNFLQLWIFPKEQNIDPRYDQKKVEVNNNELIKIVGGENSDSYLYIHQDAAIYRGKFTSGKEHQFNFKGNNKGAYIFLLEGSLKIDDEILNKRDAIGISETESFKIVTEDNSEFIIIEVPMK